VVHKSGESRVVPKELENPLAHGKLA
jgi:hypothetical protein